MRTLTSLRFPSCRFATFSKGISRNPQEATSNSSSNSGRGAINLEHELSLQVRPTTGEIKINERFIRLSPNEFLFYFYFAQRAADGDPPVESLASIEGELKSLQEQYRPEMDLGHWASKVLQGLFDPNEDLRKWAGNIRSQLKKAGFDGFQIERLVPRRGHLAIELPPDHVGDLQAP
jgi:hypothetical protein